MARHLQASKSRWFLTFSGWESNLTLDFCFGHNLCFKYPNQTCELILDIYVSKKNQWYKEILNLMNFYTWNFSLKIWLQLLKWEPTWECVGSFLHTPLHFWEHEMWLLGFTLNLHLCNPLFWLQAQVQGRDIVCESFEFSKNENWHQFDFFIHVARGGGGGDGAQGTWIYKGGSKPNEAFWKMYNTKLPCIF